eukprot:CAMPEP_0119565104 /NCGR_PEP_ID=MMETSP1352-20130426/29038_1 /TAXON_ID=265584 /ORGANISM="Stauroneis constricta, Strain CCMP1120" /LENGTH=80 /DNA_ID=CAMNT_0007613957 /DNA_START=152 /DNA_END=394 /DNA_ORIENTATION=+
MNKSRAENVATSDDTMPTVLATMLEVSDLGVFPAGSLTAGCRLVTLFVMRYRSITIDSTRSVAIMNTGSPSAAAAAKSDM